MSRLIAATLVLCAAAVLALALTGTGAQAQCCAASKGSSTTCGPC